MDRRVKRTRKAIKDAFFILSKTQEVNKIKVSELAELADINRKTFYLHYVDIFALLKEIEDEFIEEADLLVSYMSIFNNSDKREVSRILFDKLEIASNRFENILNTNVYKSIINRAKEHFKELLVKEYVSLGGTNIEFFSYVFTFYASGILDVFKEWFENHKQVSKEDIIKLMDELLDVSLSIVEINE